MAEPRERGNCLHETLSSGIVAEVGALVFREAEHCWAASDG